MADLEASCPYRLLNISDFACLMLQHVYSLFSKFLMNHYYLAYLCTAFIALRLVCPTPNRRGHYAMLLSDVCLSVTYVGPKSRTERPRKTKNGTEMAHITRDSDTTFKVKVTRPLYSARP